jgi:hypothetical protein
MNAWNFCDESIAVTDRENDDAADSHSTGAATSRAGTYPDRRIARGSPRRRRRVGEARGWRASFLTF